MSLICESFCFFADKFYDIFLFDEKIDRSFWVYLFG